MQQSDGVRLDEWQMLPLDEVAQACELTTVEVRELVEFGVVEPVAHQGRDCLRGDRLAPLRRAAALRRDFELDLFAMGLLVGYLERIEALEREVSGLRARLSARD